MKVFELLENKNEHLSTLLAAAKAALKAGEFGTYVTPKTMSGVKETDKQLTFFINSMSNRSGMPMAEDEEIVAVLKKVAKDAGISGPLYAKIAYQSASRSKKRDQRGKIDGPAKLKVMLFTEKPKQANANDPDSFIGYEQGREFKIQ